MRHRERQIVTLGIWVVYMLIIGIILSTLFQTTVDFTGLWPSANPYQGSQDAATLAQAVESARALSETYLVQAQEAIRAQLAVRVPIAVILSLLVTIVAAAATYFVWRYAGVEAQLAQDMVNAEKAKRRSRIEQLVDDLDEEELVELRSRLTSEDDDQTETPLGDLLTQQEKR